MICWLVAAAINANPDPHGCVSHPPTEANKISATNFDSSNQNGESKFNEKLAVRACLFDKHPFVATTNQTKERKKTPKFFHLNLTHAHRLTRKLVATKARNSRNFVEI